MVVTRNGGEARGERSAGEVERLDLRDFTPYLLNVAAESQSSAFAAVYKARYGMTRTEWRVLYHLDRHGPMTATTIGQRARIHKTKISRAVRALGEKRFIERRVLPTDRRSETLHLRELGVRSYRDLAREAAAHERDLEERLGPDRTALLKDLLHEIASTGWA